jgi:leucyl-tRNA synthetase
MVDFKAIQDKWQKRWTEERVFRAIEDKNRKKFYCLEMFPYPSASFLHMGHVKCYSIGDVIARFKRMNRYNVLYPMGFDSFGLPAENASKKAGIHPRKYTENAISKITEYMKGLGLSYDWDRTIATHRPEYYKWNQYFFIKFFEKGLVYRKKASVNFCTHCNTVLANEEVENGRCWRCENEVVQKELDQWFFKTTAYADQLLDDIKKLDWSDRLKTIQENWIGKSHGVFVNFHLDNNEKTLFPIFTTRPDTIFGVTFMVIALNHPKLMQYIKDTPYEETVLKFIADSKKAEAADDKAFLEKAGVFTGLYAINPLNDEKVPIYAGNFVVADYATGMIMAVPAHDQRDFEFARKYDIAMKTVIKGGEKSEDKAYTSDGTLVNSGQFNGLVNQDAIEKISEHIEKNRLGKRTVQYKLKDWLISRQRYWGTPIPMMYCDNCGTVAVAEKDLPLLLPEDVDFSKTGNPILTSKEFKNAKCPKCHSDAARETDTMGGFMDSSWYFLRYCSPNSHDMPFSRDQVDYWMPVDQYIGGIEHAVGHLIYSRFFSKVLRDMGMLGFDEPFNALFNQGILHKDGRRMSKSHGNVVTQDEIADKYGIDTARLFILFLAAPEKDVEWSDKGIEGSFRIINKAYRLFEDFKDGKTVSISGKKDSYAVSRKNLSIKNITRFINDFKFNNAIIEMTGLVDYLSNNKENISQEIFIGCLKDLALLLNPFTPHVSEECWEMIDGHGFASLASWPEYMDESIDMSLLHVEEIADNTKKDIYSVLELSKISQPNEIVLITADSWKYALYNSIIRIVAETGRKNVGEISKHIMNSELKKHGQDIMKILPKVVEKIPENHVSLEQEYGAFKESIEILEKEFSCRITLMHAEDSKEPKAKQAMPGKPAIIIR